MAGEKDRELLAAHVPAELAERFRAWAREQDGSTAAALRRLIAEAVSDHAAAPPRGVGTGAQVGVRLRTTERVALARAAEQRGVTPAAWLRSLAMAHLGRRADWSPAELEELRSIFRELRRIGVNVNQIAQRANEAAQIGQHSALPAAQAREAAASIKAEMQRLVDVMQGQLDYWGLDRGDSHPGTHIEATHGRG